MQRYDIFPNQPNLLPNNSPTPPNSPTHLNSPNHSSLIYINNVYPFLGLDIRQEWHLFCIKVENFPEKVLSVRKKCVPLHPLSKIWGQKESVLWKIYIDRSSTRSECFPILWCESTWVEETDRFNSWIWIVVLWQRLDSLWNRDIIYSGEFDPGSGWTLATGLTHASRGAAWS